MYFRKLLHITGIVCLLSIFVWSNTTHAYPDANNKIWKTAQEDLEREKETLGDVETRLADVRDAAETLSSAWDSNRKKIREGTSLTVSNAVSTLIGIVATYYTGGATVAYLPSIFQGWLTTKAGLDTSEHIRNSSDYEQAMITAIEALDIVLGEVETVYADYTNKYNVYLEIMSSHDGGLVRNDGGIQSAVYTKEQVYDAVNPRDTEGYHDYMNALPEGWYHQWESGSGPSQSVKVHWSKKHWDFKDMVRSFVCLGDCGVAFDSPISPNKLANPVRCSEWREFTNDLTGEKKIFNVLFTWTIRVINIYIYSIRTLGMMTTKYLL